MLSQSGSCSPIGYQGPMLSSDVEPDEPAEALAPLTFRTDESDQCISYEPDDHRHFRSKDVEMQNPFEALLLFLLWTCASTLLHYPFTRLV